MPLAIDTGHVLYAWTLRSHTSAKKAQAKMPINTRTHERKRPGKTNEVVKRKYISAEFERGENLIEKGTRLVLPFLQGRGLRA